MRTITSYDSGRSIHKFWNLFYVPWATSKVGIWWQSLVFLAKALEMLECSICGSWKLQVVGVFGNFLFVYYSQYTQSSVWKFITYMRYQGEKAPYFFIPQHINLEHYSSGYLDKYNYLSSCTCSEHIYA